MMLSEKLGLGTVQFGLSYGISNKNGQTSEKEVTEILKFSRQHGVQVLDSASGYGTAEEVLGKNDLAEFQVVSKFMPSNDGSRIKDQLDQSMKNLRLDHFHGYLAHRPLDLLDHPEHWEELVEFRNQGKVKKIGFSLNEPEELEKLLGKNYQPDLIQVPYNYFDRRFQPYLEDLRNDGCEIHTRSAFLQGLFFMKPSALSDYFKDVKPLLEELQTQENLNGALLKFALEKPFIDRVITGVENKGQLQDNLKSIEASSSMPNFNEKISDNILIPSRWPKN